MRRVVTSVLLEGKIREDHNSTRALEVRILASLRQQARHSETAPFPKNANQNALNGKHQEKQASISHTSLWRYRELRGIRKA